MKPQFYMSLIGFLMTSVVAAIYIGGWRSRSRPTMLTRRETQRELLTLAALPLILLLILIWWLATPFLRIYAMFRPEQPFSNK
jgi:hypothetical protein